MSQYEYGQTEINYLKSKDYRLALAIDRIGFVHREVIPDLFTGLIYCIIGQQISSKAMVTIWARMLDRFCAITPDKIADLSVDELQSVGITTKKAVYIKQIADAVLNGNLLIEDLHHMPDEDVIKRLVSLAGVGVWTAEMLLIFSMQRKDIISWDDLAIRRGMMMLYHHRKLDKKMFEKYKRRYSPFGTVASIYLWEVSLGK